MVLPWAAIFNYQGRESTIMIWIAAIIPALALATSILFAGGTVDVIYIIVILIDIFLLMPRKEQ